jgi:hypothetical protein
MLRELTIWLSQLKVGRIIVTDADLKANPHAMWNAFIASISDPFRILTAPQRVARLIFWYDSEINNGGHLQFFLNQGGDPIKTIEALHSAGAFPQARILEQGLKRWESRARPKRNETYDYLALARQREFDDLDRAFGECAVSLTDVLESLLREHEAKYIIRR